MTGVLDAESDLLTSEEEPETLDVELEHAGDGRLFTMLDGVRVPLLLRQCFPWSQPSRFLSLWVGDDREVAFIDDPARLEPRSRAALESALAAVGFVLQVTRVESITQEVEIRNWNVVTRHGPRSFQTHLDEWPRVLPDGGLLIRDVGGDLYRLPPSDALDKHSRQALWAFVD